MSEVLTETPEENFLERAKKVYTIFYTNAELSEAIKQIRQKYPNLPEYSKLYLAICGESDLEQVKSVSEELKKRLSDFESELEKLVLEAENKKP